jgi:cytochrome c556
MSFTPRGWAQSALSLIVVGISAAVMSSCQSPPQQEAPPSAPAAAAPQPAEPAVKLPVSYNALMVAMIDNAGHVLWDIEKEGFEPKNDADWVEVEDHAMQLAAASTLLQLEGSGPADAGWMKQVGWKSNAAAMGAAGMAANAAAKARNKDALIKANGDVVASCEGCHKAFKPELPTEGLVHQRPHSDSHKGNR